MAFDAGKGTRVNAAARTGVFDKVYMTVNNLEEAYRLARGRGKREVPYAAQVC
jgi:hypothetical protein